MILAGAEQGAENNTEDDAEEEEKPQSELANKLAHYDTPESSSVELGDLSGELILSDKDWRSLICCSLALRSTYSDTAELLQCAAVDEQLKEELR